MYVQKLMQSGVVSKSDQELVTLSVNLMKNGSEQDEDDPLQTTDHTKEEKEQEQDTKDTITVDPIHIKIRSTRKPCCCYYFSFLWRIWNAICGVLALAISAGFHFNIILEFMIRCSAFFLESDHTGASFAGVFGFFALYFLLSIPLWCGKQFLHAFWIMFMNTADKNRMLFVEWYRLFHVLWCILFTLIWAATRDESIHLIDTIFWQNLCRFMVLHGIVYFVVYCTFIVWFNVWVTLNLFDGLAPFAHRMEAFVDGYLNPYTWTWKCCCKDQCALRFERYEVEKIDMFSKLEQMNQKLKKKAVRSMSIKHLLFGINDVDNQKRRYLKYVFISALLITTLICWIYGAIASSPFSSFCGYGLFFYYILCVLVRRNDNDTAYTLWNGSGYKQIYTKLRDAVRSQRFHLSSDREVRIVTMDYMDYWSMIHLDYQEQDFCPCCCIDEAKPILSDGSQKKFGARSLASAISIVVSVSVSILFLVVFLVFAGVIADSQHYDSSDTSSDHRKTIGEDLYPMCYELSWANYLTAPDVVWLTSTAYHAENKGELFAHMKYWFAPNNTDYNESVFERETGWNIGNAYVEWDDDEYTTTFFHIENTKYDFDLVSVRGTSSLHDAVQDMSLWSEITVIQFLSKIIPITGIFPDRFVRDVVAYCSLPEGLIYPEAREGYDTPIYDYIKTDLADSLSREPLSQRFVFIVGHSLGGGVAEMVAAKFYDDGYRNVFSFGVSSPGVVYSSRKFGISVESLDFSSVSLLPARDPVSIVDKHRGYVQHIECDATKFVSCHFIARTFCEIYQACGHQYMRNVSFSDCLCFDSKDSSPWEACTGL